MTPLPDPAASRGRQQCRRYRCRVLEIPWWALPVVAAVSALVGGALGRFAASRRGPGDSAARWYEERKATYVTLLAAYERTIVRLRTGFAGGITEPDPMRYLDEVGPALTQVRLLASGPVRSAALAVHLLIEDLHKPRPVPVPGRDAGQHFLEKLAQIPLILRELEVAVRDELDIGPTPPDGNHSDRV